MLGTTELKTLRSAIGVTFWDRMRNKDVRDQCNIQNINKWIWVRRKESSNHVDRASEERLLRIVKDWKPAAVRPRSRTPKSWVENWESSATETWGTVKKNRLTAYNSGPQPNARGHYGARRAFYVCPSLKDHRKII